MMGCIKKMNAITNILKKAPFTFYGIFILLLNIIFDSFQFDYDHGGLITILFFLLPILNTPAYLIQELSFKPISNNYFFLSSMPGIMGVLIFLMIDIFLFVIKKCKSYFKNFSDHLTNKKTATKKTWLILFVLFIIEYYSKFLWGIFTVSDPNLKVTLYIQLLGYLIPVILLIKQSMKIASFKRRAAFISIHLILGGVVYTAASLIVGLTLGVGSL